jgi:uncharacterized membrane protein YgaE (UPF0421/DUF939 family)
MIGGIVAILMAYWFYRSAEAHGLPVFQWAFAGLISYYIPNFIWSLMVAKPWINSLHAQNGTVLATLLGFSSVLVGALAAFLVNLLVLRKATTTAAFDR